MCLSKKKSLCPMGLPQEYPYPARVKFALFDAKTVSKLSVELKGHKDQWRIRTGDWRVVYYCRRHCQNRRRDAARLRERRERRDNE